jgi:hypothetical protein
VLGGRRPARRGRQRLFAFFVVDGFLVLGLVVKLLLVLVDVVLVVKLVGSLVILVDRDRLVIGRVGLVGAGPTGGWTGHEDLHTRALGQCGGSAHTP